MSWFDEQIPGIKNLGVKVLSDGIDSLKATILPSDIKQTPQPQITQPKIMETPQVIQPAEKSNATKYLLYAAAIVVAVHFLRKGNK